MTRIRGCCLTSAQVLSSPGSPLEFPASLLLVNATPLLEEERDARAGTDRESRAPVGLHAAGTGSGFAADDHPVDPVEVEFGQRAEKWLERQELRCAGLAEMVDAADVSVFSTLTPIQMWRLPNSATAIRSLAGAPSLCQDLVLVPVRARHHVEHRWMNSTGTSLWNRSLIELTKIVRGFFQLKRQVDEHARAA